MKNLQLFFSVLIFFSVSTLHSQWLEKEGYWELEQNYGQLLDIKLNETTNELWIVTTDNKVITIDAETGIEVKRCECELEGIINSAYLSSDFLSVSFSYFYSQTSSIDSIGISLFNTNNCSKKGNTNVVINRATNVKIYFIDYISKINIFYTSLGITTTTYQGASTIVESTGFTGIYSLENYDIKLISQKEYGISNVIQTNYNENVIYGTSGQSVNVEWSNFGGGYSNRGTNFINEFNLSNFEYKDLLINEYSYDSKNQKSGYPLNFGKLLQYDDTVFIVKSNNNLYFFNSKIRKITDSIKINTNFIDFILIKESNILVYNDSKKIYFLNLPNNQLIDYATLEMSSNKLIFRKKNNEILLLCPDSKIRYVRPNILKSIPDIGFVFKENLIYTKNNVEFSAICNIDSCEYEWEFTPDKIKKTKSKEIEYSYDSPGIYDVNLTIVTPAGKRYSFKKEKIIKVIEKSKADFSFQILNKQLPRKVQFIDKTNGEVLDRLWDFGDGSTSTELNPIHEYKYSGDFTVKLIVRDELGVDTIIKHEDILVNLPTPILVNENNYVLTQNEQALFRNAYLTNDGFLLISSFYHITSEWDYQLKRDLYYYYLKLCINEYNENFEATKSVILSGGDDGYRFGPAPIFTQRQVNDSLYLFLHTGRSGGKKVFNRLQNNYLSDIFSNWTNVHFPILVNKDRIYWVYEEKNVSIIKTTNLNLDSISNLILPVEPSNEYLADTINNGISLFLKKQDKSYTYFSISPENTIASEKSFSLDTNITLSGIKSVHENLILLYGSYKDDVNNTTYAYFAKYHPLDNTLQDTILYSRKDIRKIERVNNSTYAAIGQSRGRQGYLLLDTNLHQIKDIRVENLTGEIKDMILHDNKVYLFTEKAVSNQTMALGANESYQTTASVLSLPDEIIANVEDSPKIISDKLTHSAFPNPSSDLVNLSVITSETANFSIKLYDIYGNEIIKIYEGSLPAQTEKTFFFSTSQLPIGSYYYVISGVGIIERGKVLVVR